MNLLLRIRQIWLTFIKHTLNHLTRRIARTSSGPFSIIRHIGRRSGKEYETPIVAMRRENGFVIELTYGPDVDWYKNVLAAGKGTLVWHGREVAFSHIEPLSTETGMAAFPPLVRVILRTARRTHFVLLT